MGGAGDSPAPVGDPPTGTAASNVAKRPCSLARTVAPVPSGESPDGTGGSPVLPANHFSNMLCGQIHPHPGPLPSDGRGRIVLCRSAYPTALEAARDGSGCSLSRRTGEGQGEGRFVGNRPPVRHLFLHNP